MIASCHAPAPRGPHSKGECKLLPSRTFPGDLITRDQLRAESNKHGPAKRAAENHLVLLVTVACNAAVVLFAGLASAVAISRPNRTGAQLREATLSRVQPTLKIPSVPGLLRAGRRWILPADRTGSHHGHAYVGHTVIVPPG